MQSRNNEKLGQHLFQMLSASTKPQLNQQFRSFSFERIAVAVTVHAARPLIQLQIYESVRQASESHALKTALKAHFAAKCRIKSKANPS